MENEDYRSILDCLYWTVVTISTVGFGDMSPFILQAGFSTLFVIVGGVVNYSLIISLITPVLPSIIPAVNADWILQKSMDIFSSVRMIRTG